MSTQWGRYWKLVIGKSGEGLDLSNLRIEFEVIKTLEAQPNQATIKVYNLTDSHSNEIKNVYDDVLLEAGYRDNSAQIFVGNIQFVSHYRDQTDYITEVTAGDGDRDYRLAHINKTLAAGTTDKDAVDALRKTMPGVTEGTIQLQGTARLRGKVLCGASRDLLTQIAHSNGCNWSIQDGKLHMIRSDDMIGEAIVISAKTGLLEAPEHNDKGISVKCLLNPQIAINGVIRLDNEEIRLKKMHSKPIGKNPDVAPVAPVPLNKDGVYKVIKLTHQGDNRSEEWYSLIECIGVGQPVPAARKALQAGAVPVEGSGFISDQAGGFGGF